MGAWIEIARNTAFVRVYPSHPTWVRGLKYRIFTVSCKKHRVAPHMGAWIEISITKRPHLCGLVAPHMGAWIEIVAPNIIHEMTLVAPHMGAWIEM